jgi:putative (di)nucleoside polyphosphate hydrolase
MTFLGADHEIRVGTDHPEFSTWQWMTPADITANVVAFKQDLYRSVMTYFAPYFRPAQPQRGSPALSSPPDHADTCRL